MSPEMQAAVRAFERECASECSVLSQANPLYALVITDAGRGRFNGSSAIGPIYPNLFSLQNTC